MARTTVAPPYEPVDIHLLLSHTRSRRPPGCGATVVELCAGSAQGARSNRTQKVRCAAIGRTPPLVSACSFPTMTLALRGFFRLHVLEDPVDLVERTLSNLHHRDRVLTVARRQPHATELGAIFSLIDSPAASSAARLMRRALEKLSSALPSFLLVMFKLRCALIAIPLVLMIRLLAVAPAGYPCSDTGGVRASGYVDAARCAVQC